MLSDLGSGPVDRGRCHIRLGQSWIVASMVNLRVFSYLVHGAGVHRIRTVPAQGSDPRADGRAGIPGNRACGRGRDLRVSAGLANRGGRPHRQLLPAI